MKVYFVRHGESEYNIKKLWQHRKVPLSENGKKQAEFLAKRFVKIPIDIIISSPYCRSRGTAEVISKKLKKKVIFSKLIGENKMPKESIGKYAYSKEVIAIKKVMRQNAQNPQWRYSDEENFAEFKGRIRKFFGYLNKLDEKNVLVVSHGGPIRLVLLFMIFGDGFEPETYYRFIDVMRLANTGITMCEREKNGHWNVWVFNDHAHLG